MDIRSYFPTKKSAAAPPVKEKKRVLIISDDEEDVIPQSPAVQSKQKEKKKKKRCISSDSDEDNFKPKTTKPNHSSQSSKSPAKSPKEKSKDIKKPALKEIKAVDVFGKTPVNRTPLNNNKINDSKTKETKITTEVGVHDDKDFEKTLIQLDEETNTADTSFKSTNKHSIETKSPKSNDGSQNSKKNYDKSKGDTHSSTGKKESEDAHIKEEKIERKSSEKAKKDHKDTHSKEKRTEHKSNEKTKKDSKDIHVKEEKIENKSKEKDKNDFKDKSGDKKDSQKKSSSKDKILLTKNDSKSPMKQSDRNGTSERIKTEFKTPNKNADSSKPKSSKLSRLDQKKLLSKNDKDFSVFVNDDDSKAEDAGLNDSVAEGFSSPARDSDDHSVNTQKSQSKSRKRKICDTSVSELTEEERQERKRFSSVLYKNYLNRSGPKHLGSKEIPEGTPTCLSGLAFLATGVLDSLERDDVAEIVKRCGGEMKSTLTGKVTHLICGEEAGPAKIAKAEKLGTAVISEDQFLDLIRKRSAPQPNDHKCKREPSLDRKRKESPSAKVDNDHQKKKKIDRSPQRKSDTAEKKDMKMNAQTNDSKNKIKTHKTEVESLKSIQFYKQDNSKKQSPEVDLNEDKKAVEPTPVDANSLSWVDKYKPISLKQIIGQHGDSSNVNKLIAWLSNWYANRKLTLPKPNPWAKDHKGGYYQAALLSGPPGVGKTTTVGLVCKELGFDTVEFNASDTRSKNLLKEHLTDLVSTNSLAGFVHGKKGKGALTKKHVVIMDEVDGMAGNEDRGGMQELISLIKTTSVPIICMCNDKTSQKMRSLVGNCFDLSYSRPKVEQIKAAMMTICFKEGIKIPPNSLHQMIVGANQDVRQILNLLSVWSAADKNMSAETVARDSKQAQKDMKIGPWDVVRKVFSEEEHKTMSIHDKSDLFFNDYSMSPLFVQQNYIKVAPHCHKKDLLRRFAEAADSISIGDLVESKIRRNMAWSLLPLQAMYSSVLPGEALAGHIQGQIEFPAWLGQNSRKTKMSRLAQELHAHTSLSTSGSKLSIRLDYASYLRDSIVRPLEEGAGGVPESLGVLQTYHLLREDLDSLLELSAWPGKRDHMAMVDSKVKAALTRAYNKEAVALPYSAVSVKKSRSTLSSGLETDSETLPYSEPTHESGEEEEDSDVEHDALIKKSKKTTTKAKPSTSKESKAKAASSKEKAPAKGRKK